MKNNKVIDGKDTFISEKAADRTENNEKDKVKYQKPTKQKYQRIEEVTDQTEIPAMPKDLLQEPNQQQFNTQLSKLKDQRQQLSNNIKTFIQETIENLKSKKSQTRISVAPLNEELVNKSAKFKEAKIRFESIRSELDEKKISYDSQLQRVETIKNKMKNTGNSLAQINEELESLKSVLSNSRVSVKEEKDIVQRISVLEAVIPHATQLDEAQKILKQRQEEKKEAQVKYFAFKEETTELKNQVNNIRTQISSLTNVTQEENLQIQPLIQERKDKIQVQIDAINTQIEQLKAKFDESTEKYQEQQKQIERIKYLKTEQARFIKAKRDAEKAEQLKIQKKEQREQELKDAEEMDKMQAEENQNQNVAICEILIKYISKLLPKQQNQEQQQQTPKDITAIISGKEWKKDNVSLLVSKKNQPEETVVVGKGKKNKKQQPQVQSEKAKDDTLMHNIDIHKYFEHVNIAPPLTFSQLDPALKLLQEKKQYFIQLPQDQQPGIKEEKVQKVEKEGRQKNQKKQTVELQDNSFPTL